METRPLLRLRESGGFASNVVRFERAGVRGTNDIAILGGINEHTKWVIQ